MYLITRRAHKDALMQEFRFNEPFSHVSRQTCHLFAELACRKDKFNHHATTYAGYMVHTVATSLLWRGGRARLFSRAMRRKLRSVQHHAHDAHALAVSSGILTHCAQQRFARTIATHARCAEIIEELRANPLHSDAEFAALERRVEEIFKSTLFTCILARTRSDIVELHQHIRALRAEADGVIQRDSYLRQQLIHHTLHTAVTPSATSTTAATAP